MKYLLLVSHGELSIGLKQTLGMFAGNDMQGSLISVGLRTDEAASTFGERFNALLKTLPADAEFVVLADIVGGSPLTTVCNVLSEHGKLKNALVLGGMNFSMALTILMSKDTLDNAALREKAFTEATAAIKEFQTDPEAGSEDEDI